MASVNVSNGANGSPTSPSKCCESVSTKQPCNDLSPDGEEASLQQLIESELALRIAASKETPPEELLVGLQTDFFSTTQYESPSEEVPPCVDSFDPFTTTVEQSPTFTGFSEDELKEFDQDPFCAELLSPTTQTINQSNGTAMPTNDVDLLSGLEPTDAIDLSPSPPLAKSCDLVQDLNSEFSNHITEVKRESLELVLEERAIDPLTQTIDVSPSPPLELQQLQDIEEVQEILESKPEQIIDPITQTFDLSPTPPLDTQDNKGKLFPDSPDQINSFSPIEEDPINKTIDLSPSPPISDKLKDFEELDEPIISNPEEIAPVDVIDPINQTIDLSPSPPAADTIQDETSSAEVTEILQDPMYQTYDLSPSPPVENGHVTAEGQIELVVTEDQHSPNVEIVITEHAEPEPESAPVAHFAPPVMNLEIDGFETWTVAGTEEEEEDAPPMQKSLLPERPTSLPHAVCADTTNIVDTGVSVSLPD
jgi:hypothetical protein